MQTRTTTRTVTFSRPFRLRPTDRQLQPGDYQVETDEEPIEGLPTLSYRRVEVRLFVPRIEGVSEAEMWVLGGREFDAALLADGTAPAQSILHGGEGVETRPACAKPPTTQDGLHERPKGANRPLYGTLLGILALLAAAVALGRMDLAARSAQAGAAGFTDARE